MITRSLVVAILLASLAAGGALMAAPQVEYLSREALPRMSLQSQGWGELGMDTCAHAPGVTPLRLRIKDKEYDRGLGHHANGEIVVDLDGLYETFEVEVGVQWQAQAACEGTVVFQVFVDGEKRFDSGVMHETDAAKPVKLDVRGAQELRLLAGDAGDGICCDCADWANARLTRSPAATAPPEPEPFEIARFGRVVTSDPNRTDGARSDRVHEFRAEDVFLDRDLPREADGCFSVPRALDGKVAVGLVWVERRVPCRLGLEFPAGAPTSPARDVQAQCWVGESYWQGEWKPLAGTIEVKDNRWLLPLDLMRSPEVRGGVLKVRWVFPPGLGAIRLAGLSAFTRSRWAGVDLALESEHPAGKQAQVEVYNGEFGGEGAGLQRLWDLVAPLKLTVRYSRPRAAKWDRTALRFRVPGEEGEVAFAVAIEDILESGCVYVPAAGVFVSRADRGLTLARHKQEMAGRETVLGRVRKLPDQTFAQAWKHVHNPVQSNGPTMVSLACDNRKFIVQREGALEFSMVPDAPDPLLYYPLQYPCALRPQFGRAAADSVSRHLDGGWMPIPVVTVKQGGVVYSQRVFVAPFDKEPIPGAPQWLNRKPLCVAQFTLENPQDRAAAATLTLTCIADAEKQQPAPGQRVARGLVFHHGGQVLALADTGGAGPLELSVAPGQLRLSGELPAHGAARCTVYLPAWHLALAEAESLAGDAELLAATQAYWERALAGAIQLEIPDKLLGDTIRASQVACLIAARNEADGARVSPWIAANVYGPLESEANTIVRGMDLMGQADFARRALEFYIARYSPEGYLTTGYTLIGTGWHLHSLGEHWALTADRDWLRRNAPQVADVCRWIQRQREMTSRVDAVLGPVPEYGLVPPGVSADWGLYTYRFFNQGYYCAGLRSAAAALQEVGCAGAAELVADGEAFRADLLRAYRWTQARAPVLPLSTGAWIPSPASMMDSPGKVGDYYPGADGARSWASDVEIGPQHLAALNLLDPCGPETSRMLEQLEDDWFLRPGMGDYPEDKSRADWFNLGGFAKVQPYYGRVAEVYAMRDEVKPFLRSYFNAIPALLNPENMTFWEHFHNQGAWNKTHETGSFLSQTRMMFVIERGSDLWLAPCVTSNWLRDGMVVAVRQAPTRFGPVAYRIESHVARGFIEATIEPPTRTPPAAVVIRLRHPEGKSMKAVQVNGRPYGDFDAAREIVRLKVGEGKLVVRAEY